MIGRLPPAEPGLVFRYDYVWRRDPRTTGKERPACLVATLDDETDPLLVAILPITHSTPSGDAAGMEIPRNIAETLGLDDPRPWIVLSEANIDYWPNAGIAPLSGERKGFAYGYLPPAFFERVKKAFFALLAQRRAMLLHRN